jgi:acyl carrier protein
MNRSKVEGIFQDVLSLDSSANWDDLRYQQVETWDSLGHMAIVAELEDAFGILMETDDIVDMSSFGRALEILSKYGIEGL